jgi:hypothetical protein
MTAKILKEAKGADVASAAGAMTLGDDGNYFDITGTEAITSITAKTAGTQVVLQFDSTATLTDGSNLKLDGNFTGAAGSTIHLVSDGTNWYEVSRSPQFAPTYANALAGSVVQVVNYTTTAVATGTTVIPWDNTIPQKTEGVNSSGDPFLSLAITPKAITNKLLIQVSMVGCGDGGNRYTFALFQDTTAGALAAGHVQNVANDQPLAPMTLNHYMDAGTTSATTFKVMVGPDESGTFTLNGLNGSSRLFGGVAASSITITEIKV